MASLDAFLKASVRVDVILVKIEHQDGDMYLWNGIGKLDYDVGDGAGEQVWDGLGVLGSVKVEPVNSKTQVQDVIFSLSGVDEEQLDLVDTSVKGNTAFVWKAYLSEGYRVEHRSLISEAECDQLKWVVGADGSAVITLTARGGFYYLENQSAAVWDVEEHNNYLTGIGLDPTTDTGFDLMQSMKNKEVAWLPE